MMKINKLLATTLSLHPDITKLNLLINTIRFIIYIYILQNENEIEKVWRPKIKIR